MYHHVDSKKTLVFCVSVCGFYLVSGCVPPPLFTLCRTTVARARVVQEWTRDGGVLLMGYEMYRLLSLKKNFVSSRKRKSKKPAGPIIIDLDEEDRQQELMQGKDGVCFRPIRTHLISIIIDLYWLIVVLHKGGGLWI